MTISTRGIRTPNDGDDWDLTLDLSAMAVTIDDAIGNALKSTSSAVNSVAERTALYPIPAQGNRVWRNDLGYEEAYYTTYNATTNPGGAVVAGWYPIAGNLPFYFASATQSQPIGSSANSLMATLWGPSSGHKYKGFAPVSGTSGVFVIPISGVYDISAAIRVGGASQVVMYINRNDSTGNAAAAGGIIRVDSIGSAISASKTAYLTAGDQLRVWVTQTSGVISNPSLQIFDSFMSINYREPNSIQFGAN